MGKVERFEDLIAWQKAKQMLVESAKLKVESEGRYCNGLKAMKLTNPHTNTETTFYFPLGTFYFSTYDDAGNRNSRSRKLKVKSIKYAYGKG